MLLGNESSNFVKVCKFLNLNPFSITRNAGLLYVQSHTCAYPQRSKAVTHVCIPQKVKEAEDLWVYVLLPYDWGNS